MSERTAGPVSDGTRPRQPSAAEHQARATGFGTSADLYAANRPGYPPAAVELALSELPPSSAAAEPAVVVDLGAGTGKLTADLVGPGRQVYAVEPDDAMLDRLRRDVPAAIPVLAAAEQVPLPDGCASAVVTGQAWHWFDPMRARAEVARLLHPGGTFAVMWNVDDPDDPLTAAVEGVLNKHVRPPGGAAGRTRPDPPFEPDDALSAPVLTTVTWPWRITRARLHALQDTKSYMIAAQPSQVAAVHAGLDAELDDHGVGSGDDAEFDLVQRTEVWVAVRS